MSDRGEADSPEGKLRALVNASAAYTDSERIALHRWIHAASDAQRHLANLLARVHRDGGRYREEHGTAKAVADADEIVARLIAEAE